jgi:PAS domain S-box-containing protein
LERRQGRGKAEGGLRKSGGKPDAEVGSTAPPGRVPRLRLDTSFLDSLREGVQVIGPDWTYRYVNATVAAQGKSTPERLLGRTMMECYPGIEHTPVFERIRACMADRKPAQMFTEFTFPDGSIGWFELRFQPVPQGVVILSHDVTEARRAEEAVRASQRLETVGRLAGGVAHDFNNLLSVILSYADFALASLDEGHRARRDVEEIIAAGGRAAALTRQLLAFSRKQVLNPEVLDVNRVAEAMVPIFRRVLGEQVELRMELRRGLAAVRVDATQLEQILMNLVVNARDAMPAGGRVTIETADVELDEHYTDLHIEVVPGPYVRITVTDTGAGMDGATRSRIFEPFFTTKPLGQGTGLGLATVFGIVKQSGGTIWVYSEPGRGTVFKIYFPRVEGTPRPEAGPAVVAGRARGRVLVVEDEASVR